MSRVEEVRDGTVTRDDLSLKLEEGRAVVLRGRARDVAVGQGLLVKVNTSIGASHPDQAQTELRKLGLLASVGYRPDTLMDLSIARLKPPIYEAAIEVFGGPVGTVPTYVCYDPERGIEPSELLEEIEKQAEAGVGFMTLHLTPRRQLYETARRLRSMPVVSRGGGIVVADMYVNGRAESVLSEYFSDILGILRKHGITLSVGTAFRPGSTVDALDEVQLLEIEIQGEYIRAARSDGVSVMMEGLGHATLHTISEYVKIVKTRYRVPVMPLGPIPTDAAVGQDHVSCAIGAAYMAQMGGADIINSVTRQEHTGGVPTVESVVEGLKAARIAVHAVNISRFPHLDSVNRKVSSQRGLGRTCVVPGGLFPESAKRRYSMGCERCGNECPLLLSYQIDRLGRLREIASFD